MKVTISTTTDLQAPACYECVEYSHPFKLWDIDPYVEPEGIYEPFHLTIQLTLEQEQLLTKFRVAYSQELIELTRKYVKFYQANPKPKRMAGSKRKPVGLGKWKKLFKKFYNGEKRAMTKAGWPGRLANVLHKLAHGKLIAHDKLVSKAIRLIQRKHSQTPSNSTHKKLQHWRAQQGYQHICLGDKHALKALSGSHNQLRDLPKLDVSAQTKLTLKLQYEQRQVDAMLRWRESRMFNLNCTGGKDEPLGNKTMFLRKTADGIEMVIKYPKFLVPGLVASKSKFLPEMIVPVRMGERSHGIWEKAITAKKALSFTLQHQSVVESYRTSEITAKKALSFTLQPHSSGRWRVTGVYQEEKLCKFKYLASKRLGIDQNAGFITVALINGRKLCWVKKFKISQKGSTEQHEARITEVMKKLCAVAQIEKACIVIEDLSLAHKVKDLKGRCTRRHVSRIPYRKLQTLLGRECARTGTTLRVVNPANTSNDARYRLPGMNVHLGACAMIAWRDIGEERIRIFQIGKTCLKIQGQDSPLVVEIKEETESASVSRIPQLLRKLADPRQRQSFYKFIRGQISLHDHQVSEMGNNRVELMGRSSVVAPAPASEVEWATTQRKTKQVSMRPAAGVSPRTLLIRVKFASPSASN